MTSQPQTTASVLSRENKRNGIYQEVEFRLRELVEEALKFTRHSKSRVLTVRSLEQAMQLRGIEPVYGVRAADELAFFRSEARPDGFYTRDPILSVRKVMSDPLPRPPVEVSMSLHWLAIDGVQPKVPENQHLVDLPAAAGKRKAPGASLSVVQSQAAAAAGRPGGKGAVAAAGAAGQAGGAEGGLPTLPLSHHLSAEAQLYLDRLSKTLNGMAGEVTPDRDSLSVQRDAAAIVASLARDAGLQQLVPHICSVIGDAYKRHMRSVAAMTTMLNVLGALLVNPAVDLEPYLHQVVLVVLGCVVNKVMGITTRTVAVKGAAERGGAAGPSAAGGAASGTRTVTEYDLRHVETRERAAMLLGGIIQKFQDVPYPLRDRILKTLSDHCTNPSTPLPTLCGAVIAIRHTGGVRALMHVLSAADGRLVARLERDLQDPALSGKVFDHYCLLSALSSLGATLASLPDLGLRAAKPKKNRQPPQHAAAADLDAALLAPTTQVKQEEGEDDDLMDVDGNGVGPEPAAGTREAKGPFVALPSPDVWRERAAREERARQAATAAARGPAPELSFLPLSAMGKRPSKVWPVSKAQVKRIDRIVRAKAANAQKGGRPPVPDTFAAAADDDEAPARPSPALPAALLATLKPAAPEGVHRDLGFRAGPGAGGARVVSRPSPLSSDPAMAAVLRVVDLALVGRATTATGLAAEGSIVL